MDKRFSKALLVNVLTFKVGYLASRHDFDLGNGTAQLKPDDVDRAVAYGQMDAYRTLLDAVESGHVTKWLGA